MTLTYRQGQIRLAEAGCAIVAVIAAVMYARRVETVEVVAVLLFLPIFAAVLLWDVVGGTVAGLVASVVYVAARWSAIRAVGFGAFSGLVTSRVLGFVIFGVAGGWANRQLRASLNKLVLYDHIDDSTGLYNARFVVTQIDLETQRSNRYKTVFSVVTVDVPVGWIEGLARRQQTRVLRALGDLMTESVRTVDHAAHSAGPSGHRLGVILPETGAAGARLFVDRLAEQLAVWLAANGVKGSDGLRTRSVTYPGDDAKLTDVRDEFLSLDLLEHPPAAVAGGLESRGRR